MAEDQLASIVAQKEGDEEGRFEIEEAAAQFAEPRMGPPGALTSARDDAAGLATASGTWVQVTNLPYDSDDPNYRDPFISNSGGGSGFVAGRAAAVAVDGSWVYAGGADGGLWRSRDAGSTWQAMTDGLDSTSSGAIGVNPKDHSVWYATGESSTAFDNYVGTGVYVSDDHAATWSKVGGDQLDGQMTSGVVFDGHGHVVVGTTLGIVRRALSAPLGDPWTVVAQPGTPGPYGFTFVNDVQVDPTDGMHMVGEHRLARRSDRLQRLLRVDRRRSVVVDGRPRRHQRRSDRQVELRVRQRRPSVFAGLSRSTSTSSTRRRC